MLIHNIVSDASKILKKNKIKSHLLDAEIILADLMNISREHLITSNYLPVSNKIKKKFNYAIKRRYRREPVAYITKKNELIIVTSYNNRNIKTTETVDIL